MFNPGELLVAALAGGAWLGAIWIQIWLFTSLDFTQGISFLYIPAGVRMLLLLTGRFPAAVGIFAANVIAVQWVFPPEPQITLGGKLMLCLLASAVPFMALKAATLACGVDPSLKALRFRHFLVFAAAVSLASPICHNIWFAQDGMQPWRQFPLNVLSMALGDFLGIALVLGSLVVLRMGLVRMSGRPG